MQRKSFLLQPTVHIQTLINVILLITTPHLHMMINVWILVEKKKTPLFTQVEQLLATDN